MAWLDVLDEGELGEGEGRGDAGLIDEDDAEAGANDGFRGDEVGEADAGGDVVRSGGCGRIWSRGSAVLPSGKVELLGGGVEDGALVVLFGRRRVQGVAGAEVDGQAVGGAPVVLRVVLLDVVAGAEDGGLEVDVEGIDLAEEEAGEGVAAGGGGAAVGGLGVGSGGGKGEGAGGVGGGDGVELVPADIGAELEAGGGRGACSSRVSVELPDGGLVLREGAGGGAELLEAGEGEQRQGV